MTISKFNNYGRANLTTMGDNSKMESDLSFLYMTCLLNVLYNLMKYHKNISKGLRVMACTRNDQAKDGQESAFYMTTPPLISVRLLSLFWLLKR